MFSNFKKDLTEITLSFFVGAGCAVFLWGVTLLEEKLHERDRNVVDNHVRVLAEKR